MELFYCFQRLISEKLGNSRVVQWLGLSPFTVVAWVQSMVRELRYHELCDTAKGKNKNSRKTLNSKSNLKGKGLAD